MTEISGETDVPKRPYHETIVETIGADCCGIVNYTDTEESYPIHRTIVGFCNLISITTIPEKHREDVANKLNHYAQRLASNGFEVTASELHRASVAVRSDKPETYICCGGTAESPQQVYSPNEGMITCQSLAHYKIKGH